MDKTKKILLVVLGVLVLVLASVLLIKNVLDNKNEVSKPSHSDYSAGGEYSGSVFISNLRKIDDSDIVWGDKKAPLSLIVYEDSSDIYSLRFDETLDQVKEVFGDRVLIAFRPYANKMFPLSWPTQFFLACAKEQGKFFEARDFILAQVAENNLILDNFPEYGQSLGLDAETLKACWDKDKYISQIEDLIEEGKNFGVEGSPTIFVGQELILGARPFTDVTNGGGEKLMGMENIIKKHLKEI